MSFASPKPFESSIQDKLLGLFVLLAVVVLVYLVLVNEELDGKSDDWINYHTFLSSSFGIAKGAGVSLNGVEIGSIRGLELTETGLVKVSLKLKKQHSHFYTQGSRLEIKSDIGLDTVLTGVGLVFKTAGAGKSRLPEGALLPSDEPKSISDYLDDWNVEDIAKQVSAIVGNMERVVSTLGENQTQLTDTLNNTGKLGESLLISAQMLPELLNKVNLVAENVDKLLININKDYENADQNIAKVLTSVESLSSEMTMLISEIKPAAESSPELINNLNNSSVKMGLLLNKLNEHWLLGGDSAKPVKYRTTLPSDVAPIVKHKQ